MLQQTLTAFRADRVTRFAAALSYYAIFTIVPALLILIAGAGMILGKRAGQTEILEQLSGVVGSAAADAIQQMLQSAADTKAGIVASIVGLITFVFGATGVVSEVRGALHTIWKVKPRKRHPFSYLVVVSIGALMMISLLFDGGITTMGTYAGQHLLGGTWLWKVLQLIVSAAAATVLFAIVFRFLPEAGIGWRDVITGAAVTAVLFVLGKFALGMYLWKASVGSSFGAAGSIIVVLVWVYWSALIFLFGVELTHQSIHGSLIAVP